MALLNTSASLSFGDALQLANGLFQQQVRIRPLSLENQSFRNRVSQNFNLDPFRQQDNIVFLNVTENEELTYRVVLSEKPVADIGAAIDYISRESTPLVLTSILSVRNFDVRSDPAEFLGQIVGSFSPVVSNVINETASFASNFFDLGADEIDKKISALRFWQLNAVVVEILGVRLDARRHLTTGDTFNYLIEEISLTYDESFGDNIGLTLSCKNLLNIQDEQTTKRGSKIGEIIQGSLSLANPF